MEKVEPKKFGFQKKVVDVVTETPKAENIEVKESEIVTEEVQKNEDPQTPTVTLTIDELNALMDKKIQEAKESFASEQPKVEEKKKEEFVTLTNTDDIPELDGFEYKNRRYEAVLYPKCIAQGIRTRSKKGSDPLQYIHPVTKQVYSLRLCSNQPSFFEEKQSKEPGSANIRRVNIIDGVLSVPASDIMLQKFLYIHPDKGIVFRELDEVANAIEKTEKLDLSFKAENLVRALEFSAQDALARIICPSYKDGADSAIIKNDLFVTVRNHANPALVIKYAEDENLLVKGLAKTAVSRGYLRYADYRFIDDNNVVVLEVGRNQDEWNAIAEYLQTNAGNKLREELNSKLY